MRKKIRTLAEFSGVPAGTTGTVIRFDPKGHGEYTVAIQWDLDRHGKPLLDWFTKTEYQKFLCEEAEPTIRYD